MNAPVHTVSHLTERSLAGHESRQVNQTSSGLNPEMLLRASMAPLAGCLISLFRHRYSLASGRPNHMTITPPQTTSALQATSVISHRIEPCKALWSISIAIQLKCDCEVNDRKRSSHKLSPIRLFSTLTGRNQRRCLSAFDLSTRGLGGGRILPPGVPSDS